MTDPTFEITDGFSDPFFSGSEGPAIDDRSLPVGIGGKAFLLDLASEQFSRRSVQLLNSQQAESGKDGANLMPEVWRRSVESWHQGAAQDRYDRDDALPSRYKASSGIDPWTKYRMGLLPATTEIATLGTGETAILRSIGKTLFVILPTEVQVYADAITAPTTHVDEAFTDTPIGATCDGENLYVLDDTGVIHKYTTATSTWNHAVATVPAIVPAKAMIAYVKGFLLIGNGPDLYDYTNPGAPSTIVTHRLSGWWWRSACEGLSVVYVLGGMGDRWHVCRVGVKDTGAGLDPPIVAATLPEGEFAYEIASYLNYVLIGVHQGWRFAISDSSGALTYGQVIRTPRPVKCFEGQDRFVWFGLSMEAGDATDPVVLRETVYSDHTGIGRADLATFVAGATPAAASDLYALDVLGEVTSIVTVGDETDGIGLRVFSVSNDDGGGVYIETGNLVSEGWLRQGYVSFNSADEKMGLYGQVFHEPLTGSITVEVSIDNQPTYTTIGGNTGQGTTTMGNMGFTEPFHTIEYRYTLTRDPSDATAGPAIKRTEFRAVNVPGRSTEWRIPILLAESNVYLGTQFGRSVEADYDYLVNLVQTREPFTYREGEREWTLHAIDFLWQPSHMVSNYSTYQGTFILVAREIN